MSDDRAELTGSDLAMALAARRPAESSAASPADREKASKADRSIVIDAIRRLGPDRYRVEWLGNIVYGGRRGGHSPMVVVEMESARRDAELRATTELRARSVAVPAAFLRVIRVGDVWLNGQRIGTDGSSIRLTFDNLRIDDSTTVTRPIGLPIAEDTGEAGYLLPFSQFDGHRSHTGSSCVCVLVDPTTTLVVPCVELIRFYFGESGTLLSTIFSGILSPRHLYRHARHDTDSDVSYLALAKGIPFPAATAVARIAFEDRARRAMEWIVKSGTTACANGEHYYPRTTFPFLGATSLLVDGRWVEGSLRRVFLVERLLRCTHPFPFVELRVEETLATKGDPSAPSSSKTKGRGAGRRNRDQPSDTSLMEGYVDHGLAPEIVQIDEEVEHAFPDLVGKPIRRFVSSSSGAPQGGETSEDDHTLSSGQRSPSLGGRGAELTDYDFTAVLRISEPEIVFRFREEFKELTRIGLISASLVPALSGEDGVFGNSPFARCDWIVRILTPIAENTWCARVLPDLTIPGSEGWGDDMVVLIREDPRFEGEDQVLVTRWEHSRALTDQGVREICEAFVEVGLAPRELCGDIGLLTRSEAAQPNALKVFMLSMFGNVTEDDALTILQTHTFVDGELPGSRGRDGA